MIAMIKVLQKEIMFMIFRNSKKSDIDEIMNLLGEARESIGKLGIDQWQYGYPSRDIVADDIKKSRSYVCEDDGEICAVFTIITDGEPTYDKIYDGKWMTEDTRDGKYNYYALHRIAVSNKYRGKGVARQIINFIRSKCIDGNKLSIRVDTHKGNIPMIRMLKKNGFEYRGIIYLKDGQERVAYEALIHPNFCTKIYDISREILSAEVYPGDTKPTLTTVRSFSKGDGYNLSDITMCVHNSTHIDAPSHFIDEAPTVDSVSLYNCVGDAYVISSENNITNDFIALQVPIDCHRLLIKGDVFFEPGVADKLAERNIVLVGVESQSVSEGNFTKQVHIEMLRKGIVIVEGLDLSAVPDGKYELCALPLKIAECDGAPCRAILIKH